MTVPNPQIDAIMAANPGMSRQAARNELKRLVKDRPSVDLTTAEQRELRRLREENPSLRKQRNDLQNRLDAAEELRESVFGIRNADLMPPRWPVPKARKGRVPHQPILFGSDFQYGEEITLAEMDGMNEYNRDIFVDRYTRMIDKTIRWCDSLVEGWGAEYPHGIVYLRGGDAISGDIHAELIESNDVGAIPAVRDLVRYEREGIRRLKERFGHVHVISIPGNHGRTTMKPRFKGYVSTNYETIISWWLQDSMDREPGVTFETPASGYARFNAMGWRFEMRHGDRMGAGGGTGWIGSPAPISKGHKKIRLDAASVGDPVDYTLTGHLHTSMQLPRGFANGSLPGYNEFARGLGLEPDAAKQWLLIATEKLTYGIELVLSDFPRRGQ